MTKPNYSESTVWLAVTSLSQSTHMHTLAGCTLTGRGCRGRRRRSSFRFFTRNYRLRIHFSFGSTGSSVRAGPLGSTSTRVTTRTVVSSARRGFVSGAIFEALDQCRARAVDGWGQH